MEVHLSFVEGDDRFQGKCRNCDKVYGLQVPGKECKKRKGNLHGGRTSESKGGNTGNVASTRGVTSVE